MEEEPKPGTVKTGRRLSVFRKHLKLNQKQAAQEFDVGVRTWQRFEADERVPNSELLMSLAEAGLSLNWLMTGEPPMLIDHIRESSTEYTKEGALSREERIVIDNFRALSETNRAHAKALFNAMASKDVKKDKTG
ncbi:MAG: helix-turn-helix transcriptional regulator [Planctomycetes bacterium]|nr:helix-turn-helix transcriptional regulator [Planctomycetota bacterium]